MFVLMGYNVYVESSIDHYLAVAASALASATDRLRSGEVVNASIVTAARAIVDQADLFCTRTVAEFDGSPAIRDDGFRNVSEWLAGNTHARPSEGETRVGHARVLAELAGWADAATAGVIGSTHVEVLAKTLNRRRLPFLQRDAEMLLRFATSLSLKDFRVAVAKWVSLCDDALSEPTVEKEHEEQRRVQLSPVANGMWLLSGMLDALGGDALRLALESAMPKPCEGDNRTPAQRRHDALVDIANESLANEDRSEVGGERPHVTVFVDAGSGIAHTSQWLRLSSFTRDVLLCDCVTTSVWLSADGTPFDVGTPWSSVPARNRRAVLARDHRCRAPGCSRPARWTDIHHIRERERGGTHELTNLCALCKFHHRWVHKNGIKIRLDRDHTSLIFEWPDGRTANSPPPPQVFFAR